MAGQLTVDTLKASSGVLATQNGMTGICKAWILYNGQAGTITGSFNVSSVTKNSTGYYTLNYTTAMPNANYAAVGSCFYYTTYNASGNDIVGTTGQTTTSVVVMVKTIGSLFEDVAALSVAVLSS